MINFNETPLLIDSRFIGGLGIGNWFATLGHERDFKKNGDVATIDVHGVLTKKRETFDSILGTTSYEEIQDLLTKAMEDDSISKIVLDIDSPGGEVNGLFDLCDFIYGLRDVKTITAFVNDHAFSAAYAIASSASQIKVTRTGGVGSIGVIATHLDCSELDKKEGVKYTSVFAGAKKNDLTPHEPLTDGALLDLQREVDRLYEIFIDLVARNRNISPEKIRNTEAGVFYGEMSISNGFADELATLDWNFKFNLERYKMDENQNDYKAQVKEILTLCAMCRSDRLAEFLEKEMSVEDVKKALLNDSKEDETILNIQPTVCKSAISLIDLAKHRK